MPFVNVPVVVARQILTAAIFNQLGSALTGFLAQAADLAWPLTARGNIDMQNLYTIENMRNLWKIVNMGEYPDLTALSDALATSSGCLLIPPNTTISSTGATIARSLVHIKGCGPSSVLKLSSGTGPLLQSDTGGRTDLVFEDLTLDGSSLASGTGIKLQGVARIWFKGTVHFKNFLGPALEFVKGTVDGVACTDVFADTLIFSGGGSNYIKASDLARFHADTIIMGVTTAASGALYMEPVSAASLIQDISIDNLLIDSPTGKGVSILGSGAAGIDAQSRVTLGRVRVINPTSTGIEVGATSKVIKDPDLLDCQVLGTIGGTGISVRASRGTIHGGQAQGAIVDGLVLGDATTGSTDVVVTGGNYKDAGANGINAEKTTRCTIVGADVRGAVTEGIRKDSAVDLEACGNLGDISRTADQQHWNSPEAQSALDAETTLGTYTIPANTLSKPGDGFRLVIKARSDTLRDFTVRARLGGGAGVIVAEHTIPAHATLRNGVIVAEVRVNSADVNGVSNIGTTYYGLNEVNTNPTVANATVTANMTADQVLAITGDNIGVPTSGGVLNNWKIEFIGGEFV